MAELSSQYNAVVDWPRQMKDNDFSIDVEPIFVRADQRPTLFYANLEDVKRQSDQVLLFFRTTPTEGEPSLQLILDCGKCDLQKLKEPADMIGDFGLVAQVNAVAKAIDGPDDGPDYILHGRFVQAQFVGDYALNKVIRRRKQ